MAELDLVEERLISGTGLLRVPSVVEDTRYLRLNIDVIRQVPQPFESFKWSPTRSRYCTLAFMRDGYVVQEEPVDYERRQFEFVADSPGQTLIAVKCMYKGILETFVNLGNALILAPFIVDDKIADYENLRLLWDEVQIVCEGSTAIQARLFALRYDDDCESSNERRLPPPPPPLPRVPPTTGIGSISLPYNNDNITRPNVLDEDVPPPEPDPVGTPCQIYQIVVTYTLAFGAGGTGTFNWSVRAPFLEEVEIRGIHRNEIWGVGTAVNPDPSPNCEAENMAETLIGSLSAGSNPPPQGVFASAEITSIMPPL